MIFLPLAPPRWLAYAETQLTHPDVAPWVDTGAAWVALDGRGEPVRYGHTGGYLSISVRLFSGPESAADHGTPALVDLYGGEPVRMLVVGHDLGVVASEEAPAEVIRPATSRAA